MCRGMAVILYKQQVPGVVVLVATALLAGALWPWAFCACSDTT